MKKGGSDLKIIAGKCRIWHSINFINGLGWRWSKDDGGIEKNFGCPLSRPYLPCEAVSICQPGNANQKELPVFGGRANRPNWRGTAQLSRIGICTLGNGPRSRRPPGPAKSGNPPSFPAVRAALFQLDTNYGPRGRMRVASVGRIFQPQGFAARIIRRCDGQLIMRLCGFRHPGKSRGRVGSNKSGAIAFI